MTRLENQSPLTQTLDEGEEKLAGSDKLEGMEGWEPFGWVKDC
jgi:hypothetical protein